MVRFISSEVIGGQGGRSAGGRAPSADELRTEHQRYKTQEPQSNIHRLKSCYETTVYPTFTSAMWGDGRPASLWHPGRRPCVTAGRRRLRRQAACLRHEACRQCAACGGGACGSGDRPWHAPRGDVAEPPSPDGLRSPPKTRRLRWAECRSEPTMALRPRTEACAPEWSFRRGVHA